MQRQKAAAGESATTLDAAEVVDVAEHTFPNGCHMAEVEVDPETGVVEIVRYRVCDDFGKTVNPMIVRGQVHGGVAQGLGQALLERTSYDASGQLLSGSFMDYALPRADDLPDIEVDLLEVPSASNPLGVKGAGEAGSVGSPPALINAIIDALSVDGVTHIDMPATPENVWKAMSVARSSSPTHRAPSLIVIPAKALSICTVWILTGRNGEVNGFKSGDVKGLPLLPPAKPLRWGTGAAPWRRSPIAIGMIPVD